MNFAEALTKLVNEYGLSNGDISRLLKTSRSQVGMALRGLRGLPDHSQLLLFDLQDHLATYPRKPHEIEAGNPAVNEMETFRTACQQRLVTVECQLWKAERKLSKMTAVKERSAEVADICHHVLKLLPETEDVHAHFRWKLRNRKKLILRNGPISRLELEMKKDLFSAEANIISKYLAMIDPSG